MRQLRSFYWGTEEAGLPDLPSGARWLPVESGTKPSRVNRLLLTWRGREMPASSWSSVVRVPTPTIYHRIVDLFWDIDRSLSLPPQRYDWDHDALLRASVRWDMPALAYEFNAWLTSGSAGIRIG